MDLENVIKLGDFGEEGGIHWRKENYPDMSQ
jgi:hypothetical protein